MSTFPLSPPKNKLCWPYVKLQCTENADHINNQITIICKHFYLTDNDIKYAQNWYRNFERASIILLKGLVSSWNNQSTSPWIQPSWRTWCSTTLWKIGKGTLSSPRYSTLLVLAWKRVVPYDCLLVLALKPKDWRIGDKLELYLVEQNQEEVENIGLCTLRWTLNS